MIIFSICFLLNLCHLEPEKAAHNSTTIASSFATIADAMAYHFFYAFDTTGGIGDESTFTKNMTIIDPINDSDQQNFATAFAEPVGKQQSPSTSRDREFLPDYQPLCRSVNKRVELQEQGYEFRPPFYISNECQQLGEKRRRSLAIPDIQGQICLQSGWSCVQRSTTIQIAKRQIGISGACWVLMTRKIYSGCECMWPVHSHGDNKDFE